MMTIRQAIQLGVEALADVPDPETDTLALLCETTGEETLRLRLRAQEPLTTKQEERFRSLLLLRAHREPLQYMLGYQCFYGYDFHVDPRVLIPRQETETLCEQALIQMRRYPTPRVLDVCTGSGAIAITLKREHPNAIVTATDLSPEALSVARANAEQNHAEVRFLQGDLLAPVSGERFDVLVSNPPYVMSRACDELQPEVMREPRMALDGGADGLDFYRRLAAEAPACLASGGALLMEVGDGQAEAVAQLLSGSSCFTAPEIYRDLYGAQRVVAAHREAFPT